MRRWNLPTGLNALSIGAAAWFTWLHTFAPLLGTSSLWTVLGKVLLYAAFGIASSAFTALCVYFVLSKAAVDGPTERPWRFLGSAIWYAPATILASSMSPASLAASSVLIVATTSVLAGEWKSRPTAASRGFTPSRVLAWRAVVSFLVSLVAHASIAVFAGGVPLVAAALFTNSVGIVTALAIAVGAFAGFGKLRQRPAATLGAVLTLILAASISVIHLASWIGIPSDAEASTDPAGMEGNLRGVILLAPAPPRRDVLVAPPPPSDQPSTQPANRTIPFSGEYWIYRAPFQSPPEGSLREPGSPLTLSFSTPDHAQMFMEARQTLQPAVSGDCCIQLKITLRSQDVLQGALKIQPSFADTSSVLSLRQYMPALTVLNGEQTLEFPVQTGQLHSFNQIRISFSAPPGMRLSRNPRVEIESFTLVAKIR